MMTLSNRNIGWRKGTPLFLILLGALFLMAGCGTLGKAKNATMGLFDGFGSKAERVKQRIALIPFENRTPWDENQTHRLFMEQVLEMLGKKCPRIVLVQPGEVDYPEAIRLLFPPTAGAVDNIGLAKTCREAGMNGVITGQLTHISAEEEKQGIYGFRKTVRVARVKLDVMMYHSGTAAKLMDETFSFDVEMLLVERDDSTRKWVINDALIHEPLSDSAKTAAKTICEKMSATPWEGAIVSVNEGKAVIPFGETVGLSSGDTLEVYEEGTMIDAAGGYRYIVPGVKIGEMKISTVSQRRADAMPAEGVGTMKVGNIVRLKK